MNRFVSIVALIAILSAPLIAQELDSTVITAPPPPEQPPPARVFYGGTLGLSFGTTFRVSVQPFVGWVFNPKLAAGLKVGYEYATQETNGIKTTWNNYGASVFGRYRFIPRAYLHSEFAYYSYGYKVGDISPDRYWVPFILLGGGYVQPISPSTSFFVEVLFDVLQDDKSPYDDWSPLVSVGVSAGF